MEHRIRKLKARMRKEGLDGFLLTNLSNIRYLTGYSGSSAVLYMGKRPHFFTDFRYKEQSQKEVTSKAVIHIIDKNYPKEIAQLAETKGSKTSLRIGFETTSMRVGSLETYKKELRKSAKIKWVPINGIVEDLRIVKEPEEIELISKAASITDKVFAEILPLIKPGITEMDLSAEIIYRFMKYTGLAPAFASIVASGPNSAMPHAQPTDRKLTKGDFLTFDIGAQWKGYASDFTRTVVIGKSSTKHREIYSIVHDAHQRAMDGVKAGVPASNIDKLARSYISEKGYGSYFGHSLGHGVGLNVHEAPSLSSKAKEKLPAGTVVTIEPGIYLPGWGGVRIEDLVVVTKEGVRILSKTQRKKLIEI